MGSLSSSLQEELPQVSLRVHPMPRQSSQRADEPTNRGLTLEMVDDLRGQSASPYGTAGRGRLREGAAAMRGSPLSSACSNVGTYILVSGMDVCWSPQRFFPLFPAGGCALASDRDLALASAHPLLGSPCAQDQRGPRIQTMQTIGLGGRLSVGASTGRE